MPAGRSRYLAEIATCVRNYHDRARSQAAVARERQALVTARELLVWRRGAIRRPWTPDRRPGSRSRLRVSSASRRLAGDCCGLYRFDFPRAVLAAAPGDAFGNAHPRVSLPRQRAGDLPIYLMHEGESARPFPLHRRRLPLQAGRRADRMFAGEGDPFRTNGASASFPRAWPPNACPPPSIRSPSMAATPTSGPTFTARSAMPGFQWPHWTT